MCVRFCVFVQNQLAHYVRLQGQKLGAMIRKALDTPNWLKRHEPREVELVMELLVDEILTIQRSVSRVYGTLSESERSPRTTGNISDVSTTTTATTSTSQSATTTTSTRKVRPTSSQSSLSSQREPSKTIPLSRSHLSTTSLSDIDQLFAKKVQYFGPVNFSLTHIVTSVIKICLKVLPSTSKSCLVVFFVCWSEVHTL